MGSVWTWGILGRVIDRGVHAWYTHLFLPDRLQALATDVTNTSTAVALREYADRLEHRHEAPLLVGNRHFYTSDFQVHRRATWIAALKMHSVRTIATECLNGENLKGEHIGDGVLNLYTRDAQYGSGEESSLALSTRSTPILNCLRAIPNGHPAAVASSSSSTSSSQPVRTERKFLFFETLHVYTVFN
ncbi:unnamed protein product [Rotaria sordida]|uniref:Polysaccharide lyase family 8 central domain-containing protein n=1 Tax=Rotaria sordida TaxID=392033 RepID=A0A814PC78_9BILA|nr:unnamed protein product [Rotaria sordida]CAF3730331.1 unnamed protein product [Rotaria sordida]